MSKRPFKLLWLLLAALLLPLPVAADDFPLPPDPPAEEAVTTVPLPGVGLPAGAAYPVFAPGQVLTAAQLNAALAAPTIIGGTIDGAVIGATNSQSGRFSTLRSIGTFQQDSGNTLIAGIGTFQVGDNTQIKRAFFNSYMTPVGGVLLPSFRIQGNAFGTITVPGTVNTLRSFTINSDSMTGAATTGHYFQHTISAGSTHGRNAMQVFLHHEGASTMQAGNYYVSLAAWAQSIASAGGTGGAKMGNLFGANISSLLKTGAGAHWSQAVGLEINVGTQTGTEVLDKVGLQIVQWGTDAVAASRVETGLLFAAQSSAQVTGWKTAIGIGANHGTWPMHPSGTIMGFSEQNTALPARYPLVVANGIDFATVPAKFTTAAFASPGFKVDGTGQMVIGPNTLGWSSAGLAIGAAGRVGAVSAIAAGGTGYRATDIVKDSYGGVYQVATVSSGAITALTTIKAPTITSGSAPSNPLALTGGMGSNATINATWAVADEILLTGATTVDGIFQSLDALTATTLTSEAWVAAATEYRVAGTKVLGARITGWGAPSGTATRTTFDTATVTLEQLAQRVKAMIDDNRTHGFYGN